MCDTRLSPARRAPAAGSRCCLVRRRRGRVAVALGYGAVRPSSSSAPRSSPRGRSSAELMAQVLERHAGVRVERRFNLGGTQCRFDALRTGAIDGYAEYTGTGLRDILHDTSGRTRARRRYARVSGAFRGALRAGLARPLRLQQHLRPDHARGARATHCTFRPSAMAGNHLRYGVSHEFLQRQDGMPGLRRVYGLDGAGRRDGARSRVPGAGGRSDRRLRRLFHRRQARPPRSRGVARRSRLLPSLRGRAAGAAGSARAGAASGRGAAAAGRPDRRGGDAADEPPGGGRAVRSGEVAATFCARWV